MTSVAVVSNTSWSIFNFRKGLITRLVEQNYSVYVIAPEDKFVAEIKQLGCTFVPLTKISNKGKNPIKDLQLLLELKKLIRQHQIQYCFFFTPKINIYGCFATKFTRVKSVATINGLGFVFNEDQPKWLKVLVKSMYRLAFRHLKAVYFQNQEDRDFFISNKIVSSRHQLKVLKGSGVNLEEFQQKKHFNDAEDLVFLLSARLIKEKGIYEYVEAAKAIKLQYPRVHFQLVGLTANNPSAISANDISSFQQQGIIEYLGTTDNMSETLNDVDVLVLPSYYREGIPKILIEGLSKGIPLVTTNNVGCKETVEDGVNGYLVPVKDVAGLEKAMTTLIKMPIEQRIRMGEEGRKKAVNEFDETFNHQQYLEFIREQSK